MKLTGDVSHFGNEGEGKMYMDIGSKFNGKVDKKEAMNWLAVGKG